NHPAAGKRIHSFNEKKRITDYFTDSVTELIKEPWGKLTGHSGNANGTRRETTKGSLMLKYAGYGGVVAGTTLSGAEQIHNISTETFTTPGSDLIIAGIGFIPYPDQL